MRLLLRTGILLGMAATACKESVTPVDLKDPVALSANLSAADSAIKGDVFRSFATATLSLNVAAAPAIGPAASLVVATQPQLQRSGGLMLLPSLREAGRLQAQLPSLSAAAAQGRVIPDSLYGRVYEWDATLHQYSWQGTTVTGLTGVRFILYAVGLDDRIVEPVTAIGSLDIIDQSTPSTLQVQVLVQGPNAIPTYVDYTISLTQTTASSAVAAAHGSITNGQAGGANKTLSFDQTLTIQPGSASAHATFALNNPAITFIVSESAGLSGQNLVVDVDFQLVQAGQPTIDVVGHVTISTTTNAVVVNVTVNQGGHPVASISGDPTNPATQWKDAGGNPMTAADLAALEHLFDAFERFQAAVEGLFSPITTFAHL